MDLKSRKLKNRQLERIFFAFVLILCWSNALAQNSLGRIIPNTNAALPSSYNFQEYVYPEPDDQGNCLGLENTTAQINEIYLAQTHRNPIDHPFFFLIGQRPALLQLAVTGEGPSPDVKVEGFFNGEPLGTLCLKGPAFLQAEVDLNKANFTDYFSVTLPKSWIRNGLELLIQAGSSQRRLASSDLKIGPFVELNLVMVNMDVLNYNEEPHRTPAFSNFLEEMASAMPASVVRFGTFPETMTFPEFVATNGEEQLVRLSRVEDIPANGIFNEGNINIVANAFLENLHKASGDFLSTVYFGNTLNLAPGGWGGGSTFVSFDFQDIFIHELGHALSLPHWEEANEEDISSEDSFFYPYSGEDGVASGRGDVWNFIQDTYEFENPFCDGTSETPGLERSDAMQREIGCLADRANGKVPWDGFGNFSALAMYRYLTGAERRAGTVQYRGREQNYQLAYQDGFPVMSLEEGKRVYKRDPLQPINLYLDGLVKLPWEEKIEQEVYLVYGSAHPTQPQANMVYEPIKYKGTLTPIIDPTDPITYSRLRTLQEEDAPNFANQERDLTVRVTYEDGQVLHAIVPFSSPERRVENVDINRRDISYFTLVVPGTQKPCKVDVFYRPFIATENDFTSPETFMESARLLSSYTCDSKNPNPGENPTTSRTVIYPNPFSESLTVYSGQDEGATLVLYNFLGQKVSTHQLSGQSTEIEVPTLSMGTYIAVVNDKKGRALCKHKLVRRN